MADLSNDWRVGLIERYPDLFHPSGSPPSAQGWPCVGDGWRDLLERACVRIRAAIQADGGSFRATQIKEKYGSLRLYWRGRHLSDAAEHAVDEAVALAEARSGCTCEVCGAPGVLHDRGGWLATACPDHARGEPVTVEPGFENIHIVRAFEPGRYPITSCRRYDRATDTFIDVDPKTLGIER